MDVVLSLLLLSCITNGVKSINGGRPPVITAHPNPQIAYKEHESVELLCDSSGFPKPEFFWEKDGLQLNMTDEYDREKDSGKLTIKKATAATTDGVYQCFARNDFGVAVTQKTTLKKAELGIFPTADVKTFFPFIGDKLILTCKPPSSYPAASIYWGKTKVGSKLQPIENTERISLDYDGNLHFSNIIAEDYGGSQGFHYLCAVQNQFLRSIVQGEDHIIEPISGNLYFSNVEKVDYVEENQVYICVAEEPMLLRTLTQGNDRIVRQPANDTAGASYHRPALMWSSPTSLVAIREQTARMKCIFSGLPTPTVTWKRMNGPLPAKAKIESFGQDLVIPGVNVSDRGVYQCTGNNTVTGPFISHNFTLTVEAAPYWKHGEAPKDINASEDDTVEFECNAAGMPNPTIIWTINGRPLSEAESNSRRVVSGNRIRYINVQKNDSQVFQCLASNHHGSIMANAYLFVRAEKPSILDSLPKLTKAPEEKTIILMCRMDGAPKPVITWHRGSDKIPVSSGDRFTVLPTGDLEITNPSTNDSDMYYCTGENKFDKETADGRLVVRRKTLITEPPQSRSVNVSERVEFACRADTDPEELSNLNITWYKNSQPLSGGSAVVIGDRLVIDRAQVSDSGAFTCRADNKVDTSEATAELIVKDRPSPPTNVRIIGCLTTRAEVSWNAGEDNNDPIIEYVVYYNASYDPPEGYHVGVKVTKTSATVHPLTHWANYTFHVTARNGLGTSDRSAFSTGSCSTSQATPHANPTGVCTRNGKPRELVITWKLMSRSQYHGEGFHYLVKYQRLSDADVVIGENMSAEVYDKNELVVQNQEIYKRYRISVSAVNNVGSAPPDRNNSVYYGYSSEGVPTVTPMNFRHDNKTLNSTSVTFLWDPVDESPESINGRFLGYRVFFWRRDHPDDVRTEDKSINPPAPPCPTEDRRRKHVRSRRSSDDVELTTHRLWGGASIVASAVVVNGASTGGRSDSIEFNTPEGVPDMVNSLEIVERGAHHLKIEWTAPLEINGKLEGYDGGYIDANGKLKMFYVSALRTTKKILGLSQNSTYQIFIEARTSAGAGLRRSVDGTTLSLPLSGSQPDVPKIEEPELGDTFAVIKWRSSVHAPPKNPGSSFHVEYKIKDSNEVNRSVNETQHNWINLTDLDPGKPYHVAVVASNPSGESSRSEQKEFILGKLDGPVLRSAEQSLWWLIVLILLILILLIIIIIILCCLRHRRQGKYAVYEKEKLHGCNTDTANEEPTFGEYSKSAVPTLQAPYEGSMDSIVKPLESDSNSLAEYEETDPMKFNEDGSFIGQYGGQKKEAAQDLNAPFATVV